VADSPKSEAPNGKPSRIFEEEEQRLVDAMEGAHEFPGFYPVVVIARHGLGFEAELNASIAAVQGEAPFRIRERSSREGNYISYHVELYVESALEALERKAVIGGIAGVIVLL
jgi:hypothetical protein